MRISDWSSDVCSSDLGASRYLDAFLEMLLAERGAAANTVLAYARDLADCAAVVAGRGGRRSDDPANALDEAGTEDLRRYLAVLESGGISPRTAARRLSTLRQFYRFLHAEGLREDDPTAVLESPRRGRPLPKILSEADVGRLL